LRSPGLRPRPSLTPTLFFIFLFFWGHVQLSPYRLAKIQRPAQLLAHASNRPFLFVRRACLLQQLCNENVKQGKIKAYLLWTRTCRCWAKLLFIPSFSCSSCFCFLTFCLSLVPAVFFLVFVRPLSVFVFFLLFCSLCSFLALFPLFLQNVFSHGFLKHNKNIFLHFWILQHVCKTPKGIGQYSKKNKKNLILGGIHLLFTVNVWIKRSQRDEYPKCLMEITCYYSLLIFE